MYKAKAVKAIIDIKSLNIKEPYLKNSYMYQSGEDELTYVIDEDDFENGGRFPISILELYLEGNEEQAKTKYKEIYNKQEIRFMDRRLDGMYFRVKRDEKWCNVCVSDMTDEELDEYLFSREDFHFINGVVKNLVHCLREIGDMFDITGGNPDHE